MEGEKLRMLDGEARLLVCVVKISRRFRAGALTFAGDTLTIGTGNV